MRNLVDIQFSSKQLTIYQHSVHIKPHNFLVNCAAFDATASRPLARQTLDSQSSRMIYLIHPFPRNPSILRCSWISPQTTIAQAKASSSTHEQRSLNRANGTNRVSLRTSSIVRLSQQRHLFAVALVHVNVYSINGEITARRSRAWHEPEELSPVLVPFHGIQILTAQIVFAF